MSFNPARFCVREQPQRETDSANLQFGKFPVKSWELCAHVRDVSAPQQRITVREVTSLVCRYANHTQIVKTLAPPPRTLLSRQTAEPENQ